MVTAHQTILALLILQIYASAAPSSTIEPEDTAKIENEKSNLDILPSPVEESKKDGNTTETQRQKRFYNHYGYGFPPISPVQYPTYNKRDQASDLGVYGIDDPLSQIHRRLQEIASFTRQPSPLLPPPVPTHFQFYFPVIFVPQHCACGPNTDIPNRPTVKPDITQPATQPPVDGETTTPNIFSRLPEMEDERQNWGLVVNETDDYDSIGEDFSRPISFDPIVLNSSMSRPAPPVEHGSNQAGTRPNQRPSSTTVRPDFASINEVSRPSKAEQPLPAVTAGAASFVTSGPYPANSVGDRREAPTTCDGAVLSCCHQPQITYDCFAVLGCPDPTSYGNPCDPLVILRVIGKYQQFYGVRNG